MNLLQLLRDRIQAVIGVLIASIALCVCGVLFTFVFAPGQALEAARIRSLPSMDADSLAAAAPGADVLVTGWLAGNAPLHGDLPFVAYLLETWEVTPGSTTEDGETEPDGDWETVERAIPDLTLEVNGQTVQVLSSTTASLGGPLHEEIVPGNSREQAQYQGEWLPEGSLRYRGFYNGDLITVLGQKAATGGVVPEKLYAGDRVAFEQSETDAARGMLFAGIGMMVCAPILLIGGGLAALFGRRARRL